MPLLERLRWAVAPVQQRGLVLLWGGFTLFAASGAVSMLGAMPAAVNYLLYAGMLAGWSIAAAGVIGCVRGLYGQASAEMRKVHAERMQDEKK